MIRCLITAGPTREPIDAVRYLSNRSSGRMGIALAAAAQVAGWQVTLALGPVGAAPPAGVAVERFETTADLERVLAEQWPRHDVLIMAAAVSDYRPARRHEAKLSRQAGGFKLELESTPDLLAMCAAMRRSDQLLIGFALEEPATLLDRAREKLQRKNVDAIIANPLATMDGGDIEATIITRGGQMITPGKMSKEEFARWVVGWVDETGERLTISH